MVRMGAGGCKWVHIDALGHRVTGRQENKGERDISDRSEQYLAMHDHCKEIRKSAGMIAMIREGKGGECRES